MEAQPLTFSLIDTTSGYEATPERVRLAALAEFTSDVSKLLRGSTGEVDPATLEVAVRSGSVALETADIAAAPVLFNDLKLLVSTELIDALDEKRREVIAGWQKAVRKVSGLSYRISAPFLERPLVIDATTDFRSDDADQWVTVERYVRGVIEALGGALRPNGHVRLPDGKRLTVTTERKVLHDDTHNRLYKEAMLRIRAKYNVLTRELKDAELIEFVEYAPRFEPADMERLTRRGAQAWKDVADATTWVDELRGGSE